MTSAWYYSHDDKTYGPLSAEAIRALAAQGKIDKSDRVWPEGSAPQEALLAEAILQIKESAADELPDWLEDVRSCQRVGPIPPPEPSHELPEWMEDLRIWLALDYFGKTVASDNLLAPSLEEGVSRAVEKWFPESPTPPLAKATPPALPQIPAPVLPPAAAAKASAPSAEPKKAIPVATPVHVPEPKQAASIPKEVCPPEPQSRPPVVGLPSTVSSPPKAELPAETAGTPPPSNPAAPPKPPAPSEKGRPEIKPAVSAPKKTRTSPAVPQPVDFLAEQALQQTGFDPRTGKILDPARFQGWKKEQARTMLRSGVSNASLMEVFRKARTAVENWLDEDRNRALVLALDLVAIRTHPDIEAILQTYTGYGPAFRDKVLRHLEFMAENRCKYYTARPTG